MIKIEGKYNTAMVFTDNVDPGAISQITSYLNQDYSKGRKIRIMPDVHLGVGITIGFTTDLGEELVPNLVGVDIGCGILTVELGKVDINLEILDKIIYQNIPAGFNVQKEIKYRFDKLRDLHCLRELKDTRRIERGIGSLGGGNHFIEVNIDSKDNKFLVIHSGSRNLGNQVAKYYQNIAVESIRNDIDYLAKKNEIIEEYRSKGKHRDIGKALNKLKKENKRDLKYPKDLCYLVGKSKEMYLHDMNICQKYAKINREVMADIILQNLFNRSLNSFPHFHTVHNYINFEDGILRKGAISAHEGELVIIPINMRDGSILARGKGNPEWNYSAPHGAGRLMSRGEAKETIRMNDYLKSMQGIYTSSVKETTLDEAPFAYKSIDEILSKVGDTVDIIDILKPIFNFKA
ncbi:MAG: RtcB family protein [Tissierellaceae bacterium]